MNNHSRQDVYSRITEQIVAQLETGVRPWIKPWNAEHAAGRITRPLRHSGEPYRGINVLSLWASALAQGFSAPLWMTFRQAQELEAHVRKGEKGSLVVYANSVRRRDVDEETGDEVEREIRFLRGYTVFNVEQIDGLADDYYALAEARLDPAARIERAERFFAAIGADTRHGGDSAYYNAVEDYIQMPPFEAFRDAEAYYCTLGHEVVHHSGHSSRLSRDFGGKRFASEGYAIEELGARREIRDSDAFKQHRHRFARRGVLLGGDPSTVLQHLRISERHFSQNSHFSRPFRPFPALRSGF